MLAKTYVIQAYAGKEQPCFGKSALWEQRGKSMFGAKMFKVINSEIFCRHHRKGIDRMKAEKVVVSWKNSGKLKITSGAAW